MVTHSLPPRPSLENLRKRAKSLLRLARAGDPGALRRMQGYFDGRSELTLSQAQLVVARELGFESWTRMKRALEDLADIVDRRTIRLRRTLDASPARVWRAVATTEGLSSWFMPTRSDLKAGSRFSFLGGWDGTVSRVDPPRLIQFDADAGGVLRFELSPKATRTHFTLVDTMGDIASVEIFGADVDPLEIHQPGGRGTHWSGVMAGYHAFVDALQGFLAGEDVAAVTQPPRGLSHVYAALLDDYHRDSK